MKLDPVIKCDDGLILEEVNPQDCGVYCIFRVPGVKRNIGCKNRKSVDELLIVGVPWSKVGFLEKYGIRIEKK